MGGSLGNVVKGVLALLGCISFCLGTYHVYLGKLAEAGTAIGGGAVMLIFAFLSQFKRFKGFGVEAETWEETMEEARDLVAELRGLSILTSEYLLSVAVRLGRWDSHLSRRERFELRQKIEKMLTEAGVSTDEIERVTYESKKYELIDMASDICSLVRGYLEEAYPNQKKESSSEVREIEAFVREHINTLPEDFAKKLEASEAFSAEDKAALMARVKTELQRIKLFRSSGKILDQEVWLSRESY